MDPSDELFSDALNTLPVHATVGDVINLDSVSQDSVPLDDTLSAEGLNPETDPAEEDIEVEKIEASRAEEQKELEGAQKATVGSPKPFDASLFGDPVEGASANPASEFAVQVPVSSPSSLEADVPIEGEQTQEGSTGSGTSAKEVKKQTSVDGFETQPIGSPGGQFQFSPITDASQPQSLVAVETVTVPGGQPPISSFFEEGSVAEVSNADAEGFFDSFTSCGDGFPSTGSLESPRLEEDTANATSPSEARGTVPQQLQGSLSAPSVDQLPASHMETSAKEVSVESSSQVSSQDPPSSKQTLLELARQSSAQLSPEMAPRDQTPNQHSPLSEVTSPHVCSVQDQTTGEPLKVAFSKIHSTAPGPLAAGGLRQPQGPPTDHQELPSGPATDQPSPLQPSPQPQAQENTPPNTQLFAPLSPSQGEDVFAAAISTSQSDRRHDAWLPSTASQKVLANRMLALQGTEFVDRSQLTMPGIILEEPQGDPVKELVYRYMGEAEAGKRMALTADQVTRDEAGLKKLVDTGCLRAAVDLTGLLLTSLGQGKGQAGLPSKNTPQSLQIWLTRLALLIKLQQYSMAEIECEAFGDLDRPDLYFEYYPDLYAGRQGSMVPFSLRVLHAELPISLGKHHDALTRLYHILDIVTKILFNLESGMSEYGAEIDLTEENRQASVNLWKSREVRVLYSIGNCLLSMKDFNQAVSVYEMLLKKDSQNASNLLSGIGRIFLQLGDLKAAQRAFSRAEESYNQSKGVTSQAAILMNKAFMHMAQNQYSEARKSFDDVLAVEPGNFTAINNQSVCLLYMGKLKEALALLEKLVQGDPASYLDEGLLFNLCTLYELESSRSTAKKQALLGLVGQHKGDGFNVGCLKML
ncbi:trafficking protein particle complex subunit 12-like [Acanthaster planci]|uniref:Trafficking protein particle complex subunit 12-like n=1 Tax=Acanthaster planci TaxID=133434 RepID=A0A8B7YJN3_ACAPL|nr:trafficking protein particle complex subunit 12-like [Acanthaster planci]XP_022092837.1 trafficking protein particle complex subunit 12-like [Acanthaster planci]